MNRVFYFRPTLKSFLISLIYDLSPISVAIFGTVFIKGEITANHKISNIVMCIVSLILQLFSVYAHIYQISIQDHCIILKRFSKLYFISWTSIKQAVIRERKTFHKRNDRLLVLQLYNGNKVSYSTSTLSKQHENFVLLEIRKRIPTTQIFDYRFI